MIAWFRPLLPGALSVGLVGAVPGPCLGQPDLRTPLDAGPLTVYPDVSVPGRYYHLPPPLRPAERAGRPRASFLLTRYLGTAVRGDAGAVDYFGEISFTVTMAPLRAEALRAAEASLQAHRGGGVDLRPLPIGRVEATVIFAPLGGGEETELPEGHFEPPRDAEEEDPREQSEPGAYWRRRTYALRLDRYTAEAVWKTLDADGGLLSVAYTYVAEGVTGEPEGDLSIVATEGLPEDLGEHLKETSETAVSERAVLSDAFTITLDAARHPELVRIVDLNDRAPPDYPVLDVRCYDFKTDLRPDLHLKMVELVGEAVNGRPARDLVVFRASEPEVAVHRVRFPFAVRLDRPLRYRVREVHRDGAQTSFEWRERSWIGVLDVTTPRERLERTEVDEEASPPAEGPCHPRPGHTPQEGTCRP